MKILEHLNMKRARLTGLVLLLGVTNWAQAEEHEFAAPLFGLATAPDGSIMVSDAGAGIVELRRGAQTLVQPLPGVSGVAPIGRGSLWAVTGEPPEAPGMFPDAQKIYRVSRGRVRELADLYAFEMTNNPDGGDIISNPFDVAALGGEYALVADAGANDLLVVDDEGLVDWVATFPITLVSTSHIQGLAGCPTPPAGLEFICDLPPELPAQAVPTTVAVGPDGAYYVGELKGFPGGIESSAIWRIEPGARNENCATSPACSVAISGLTSVIDMAFGHDGTLYVVEFDTDGWLAAELGIGSGGALKACDLDSGDCTTVVDGLPLPTAVTISGDDIFLTILSLIPGAATVIELP